MASLTLRLGTQPSLSTQLNWTSNGTVVTFIRVHVRPFTLFIDVVEKTLSYLKFLERYYGEMA